MAALAGTEAGQITSGNSQAGAAVSQGGCGCAPRRAGAGRGRNLAFFPALLMAVLPKCPMCLAAWLGVFGASAGVTRLMNAVWGIPVMTVLLLCMVVALALQGRERRHPRALAAGILGCAAILSGKFLLDLPAVAYGGVSVIFIASLSLALFNLRNARRMDARDALTTKNHLASAGYQNKLPHGPATSTSRLSRNVNSAGMPAVPIRAVHDSLSETAR